MAAGRCWDGCGGKQRALEGLWRAPRARPRGVRCRRHGNGASLDRPQPAIPGPACVAQVIGARGRGRAGLQARRGNGRAGVGRKLAPFGAQAGRSAPSSDRDGREGAACSSGAGCCRRRLRAMPPAACRLQAAAGPTTSQRPPRPGCATLNWLPARMRGAAVRYEQPWGSARLRAAAAAVARRARRPKCSAAAAADEARPGAALQACRRRGHGDIVPRCGCQAAAVRLGGEV